MGLMESAYQEKRLDLAEQAGTAFVQKNPAHEKTSQAYFILGDIGLMRRDFKRALNLLNAALAKNPDRKTRIGVMLAKGRASNALGDYDGAERSLEGAIALLNKDEYRSPEDLATAYGELGETRVKQGKKHKALLSFQKALALHPQGPGVHSLQFRLAQCYQWTKAWDEAQEMLTRIVSAGDPFWSQVAQAQINEINIQESMDTIAPDLNAS
jgi:TolA-binding protein